jgi:outer membrane lipoprotein-sorting protein
MKHTLFAVATVLSLASVAAAQSDDASRLLEQSDRFRGNWPSMIVKTRIDNYEGEKLSESAEFEVAVKGDNSLVRFLSPKAKGQSLLMRGDDMWFYLPSVARPVRITPIQRLLGNTSNGDLARLRYAADYSANIAGDESVNGVVCVVLELLSKRKAATYQRIRYAVRKSDAMPVRAEFFVASGRQLKTAFFDEPKTHAGRTVVSRIVISDQVNPKIKTVMSFTDFIPKAIDDKVFNPSRSES